MYSEEIKVNKSRNDDIKVACGGECHGETNHSVEFSVDVYGEDKEWGYFSESNFQIIKCLGCDAISFRKLYMDSESMEPDEEHGAVLASFEDLFPPRIAGRSKIEKLHFLPYEISSIYNETHAAICNKQPILAGIGIRALIEGICNEKNSPGNTLEKRIDGLVGGVLTQDGATILHSLRVMGNKAAHEIKPHKEETLGIAMDVVENLLINVYVLPQEAKRIE